VTVAGRYRLYGVSLASPFPIPGRRASLGRQPVIRLEAARPRAFPRLTGAAPWFHYRRTAAGWSHLRWDRLFEFLVSPDGRAIRYRRLEEASAESFTTYLLGQVLSFSLLALGREPLHGTAVAVDGGAVGFLGDCGAGKSTLGAAMLARGFPLVTDDLMALDRRAEGYVVHPGPARIKLYPRAARLLPAARPGTALVPGTSKRVFPLGPVEAVRRAVPLRAFYVLGTARGAGVRLEPVHGSAAFLDLVRAAFNVVVTGRDRLANQFRFVARLAGSVPVRRLRYPRSLASLDAVCDAIVADLRA
jgi:hypothetical protein